VSVPEPPPGPRWDPLAKPTLIAALTRGAVYGLVLGLMPVGHPVSKFGGAGRLALCLYPSSWTSSNTRGPE